jgi:hypothetical protein
MSDIIQQFKDLKLTPDAIIFLVTGALAFFILLMKYGNYIDIYLLLVSFILGSYRVNCMILGNCNIYARIITIITISLAFIFIYTLPSTKPDPIQILSMSMADQ